jgi:hypothetical protein
MEISLWKRLRTCRKIDYRLNESDQTSYKVYPALYSMRRIGSFPEGKVTGERS